MEESGECGQTEEAVDHTSDTHSHADGQWRLEEHLLVDGVEGSEGG